MRIRYNCATAQGTLKGKLYIRTIQVGHLPQKWSFVKHWLHYAFGKSSVHLQKGCRTIKLSKLVFRWHHQTSWDTCMVMLLSQFPWLLLTPGLAPLRTLILKSRESCKQFEWQSRAFLTSWWDFLGGGSPSTWALAIREWQRTWTYLVSLQR